MYHEYGPKQKKHVLSWNCKSILKNPSLLVTVHSSIAYIYCIFCVLTTDISITMRHVIFPTHLFPHIDSETPPHLIRPIELLMHHGQTCWVSHCVIVMFGHGNCGGVEDVAITGTIFSVLLHPTTLHHIAQSHLIAATLQ